MVFPTKRNGQQKPREIFSSSQSLILPLRPYLSSFQDGFPKWGDFGCGESFCPENWQVHACKNIRWCFFSKWIFWGCSTLTVRTLQVGNLTLLVTWSRSYWMAGEQKSRGNTSTHSRSNLPVILVQGKTINCFWHRVGASWILIPTLSHLSEFNVGILRHLYQRRCFVGTRKRRLDTQPEPGHVKGAKKPLPSCTGVSFLAKPCTIIEEIPQNCHTFAVFAPPEMGPI